MTGLSNKLKALGVKVGARDLPPPVDRKTHSIESVVPGKLYPTSFGDIFFAENFYPPEYRYGNVSIQPAASMKMLAEWARSSGVAEYQKDQFAFLDTETSGLAGGTGTYAFLVGIGRFEGDHFHLAQFFMRDPTEEAALLYAVQEFLAPCKALVTYNGKSFDVPLLTTRFTLQGMGLVLKEYSHVDLLHLSRRLWRGRLESRTLGSIENNILGAFRSQEEVPGYLVPQYYFDYLRTGDARLLSGVFYHNGMDVMALAGLFSHTIALLDDPWGEHQQENQDLIALAKLFEDLRYQEAAIELYQKGLVADLPETIYWDAVDRLAALHKQRKEWVSAVALWETHAEQGQVEACEELAKYYEHEERNIPAAIEWTEAGLKAIDEMMGIPRHVRRKMEKEFNHRLMRLVKKVEEA